MTNLDSILKSRDITLPTKVHLVKAMIFPVVMYRCESSTIKKAERWRIDAFELWCWRRLLRVPWTARRSNQSILKEISPEYSLEGLMLKLKLQYFGHRWEALTHWKRPWCWVRLKARGEGDNRGWDGWMASPTWWTWVWVGSWSWWWTGKPGVLQSMGLQGVIHDWATEVVYLKNEETASCPPVSPLPFFYSTNRSFAEYDVHSCPDKDYISQFQLSSESSPTPQFKSINSSVLRFLHSPTLTSIHDHWKNHSLD